MRGAHHVEAQLIFQDVGVLALRALWHRVAGIGEGLMAVQAPELDPFPVEPASVCCQFDVSESDADFLMVDFLSAFEKLAIKGVKLGAFK